MRATDWVEQVRDAAIERLRECPAPLLVEALALADQLTVSRMRGGSLGELLDARLSRDDLRAATRDRDHLVRRAAWRRLTARGAAEFADLRDIAATDEDAVVRSFAAASLEAIPADPRRTLAELLVADPVGRVAIPALAALVQLDGACPIERALTGTSAGVRRSARNWAAIRDVDARAVYGRRLAVDPRDRIALTGLAEIGDAGDVDLFREMLADDRPRLRAAGLRALAPIDRAAARAAAVGALGSGESGRVGRAAGDVLRQGSLSAAELEIVTAVALDRSRGEGARFRALALIRRYRWRHLAAVLQARQLEEVEAVRVRLDQAIGQWIATSGSIGHGPEPDVGAVIERHLDTLEPERRRQIDFALRTSSALPSRP